MWIQFPWLAMPSLSDQINEIFHHNTTPTNSYFEIAKASQSKEKIKVALNKDGVVIQRSQSARVATQNTNTITTSSNTVNMKDTNNINTTTNNNNINNLNNESLSTLLPQPSLTSMNSSYLSPEEVKRREIASRSWQAKKQDPSLGRVVSASQSRTNALIKSRYIHFFF